MKKEIILPFANPEFYVRKKRDQLHSPHPGTAVKIGEELYEIVHHYVKEGKHFYVLEEWDDSFTIRTIVEWNEEKEKNFIESFIKEKKKEKAEKIAWSLQIFLGFLPENYQNKLEEKIGLVPHKATFWSSLFEFLFCFSLLVLNIIVSISGLQTGIFILKIPKFLFFICIIGCIEGLLRLFYNIASSEPVGSLFFSFLNLKLKKEKSVFQEDYFKEILDGLIVETPYEKKHWEEWGGIKFNGENYFIGSKIKK